MHVHGIQSHLILQTNPAYAARAEAKREAERTRAKLRSEASLLANDVDEDGFIVSLHEREEGRQGSQQHETEDNRRNSQSGGENNADADPFSDYA